MNPSQLSPRETEQIRREAEHATRQRLEARKPQRSNYLSEDSTSTRWIISTLAWSKAFIPVFAVVALVASSIRTMTTAHELYVASGVWAPIAFAAAVCFTIAAEAAVFVTELVRENQSIKLRAEKRSRRVLSLKVLWRAFLVRIGTVEPLRYDELPEPDGVVLVGIFALGFTIVSNVYLGLRPLFAQSTDSLQTFLGGLWTAPSQVQLQFAIDFAAAVFPPFMAMAAGRTTARFAAEIASVQARMLSVYERDLEQWRKAYEQPLETSEGIALMEEKFIQRTQSKVARQGVSDVSIERPQRQQIESPKHERDDDAPQRARELLQQNPSWKAADLIHAGVKRSTAYKVMTEAMRNEDTQAMNAVSKEG